MTDNEIRNLLEENDLILCDDNIIRRNNDKHPACPNYIVQPLAIMRQNGENLTYFQDKIYSGCILSLREIVMNNKHFRFQTQEIKEECKDEMLEGLGPAEKNFDETRGSIFYSYLFRIFYTNAIHILQRNNAEKQMMETLESDYNELLCADRCGKKVCNINIDN